MSSVVNLTEDFEGLFGEKRTLAPSIDRGQLAGVLRSLMHGMTLEEIIGLITNPYAEALEYIGLVNGEKRCQKTSLLFNPHRLDTRTKSSKMSLFAALQSESFYSGLARATLFKNGLVSELLYQVFQLGINGVQYVNEFPPHIARDICAEYGITGSSSVLDPCAGWGGRMIGVSVITDRYTCFEPSSKTVEGLRNLTDFIKLFRPTFAAEIYQQPFEESLDNGAYDLAITSPPYYDTEQYSSEQTNSLNRYKWFEQWCRGFYFPLITKTMNQIKPSGAFIINIGDRIYPLSKTLIQHCGESYRVKKLSNYLSGRAGLGKDGADGEQFYELTHP